MNEETYEILGYTFRNPDLLTEALTHASIADHRLESNERMEFLGDAVLGLVITDYLFRTFPTYLEGELTKVKSDVVSRRVCAMISEEINLVGSLNLGKGMVNRPTLPRSIAAAALESVIAAMYLDGGLEPVRAFILKHAIPYVEQAVASTHQHNFKSLLQQYAQKQMPTPPLYVLLDEKGPDHSKCFEVCVELSGRRFGASWAGSKKEAEQKAALNALVELGLVRLDDAGRALVHDDAEKLFKLNHTTPPGSPESPEASPGDEAPAGDVAAAAENENESPAAE